MNNKQVQQQMRAFVIIIIIEIEKTKKKEKKKKKIVAQRQMSSLKIENDDIFSSVNFCLFFRLNTARTSASPQSECALLSESRALTALC